MHRALIVTGVLGVGAAIVFGLAALTATLFPNGTLVAGSWGGGMFVDKGVVTEAAPVPVPLILATIGPDSGLAIPDVAPLASDQP
jgi:hypothetical protein